MNDAAFGKTCPFFARKRFCAAIVPAFARLTVDHAGHRLGEPFLGGLGSTDLFSARRRWKNSVFVTLHEALDLLTGGQHSASVSWLPLGFRPVFVIPPKIQTQLTTRMPQMGGSLR